MSSPGKEFAEDILAIVRIHRSKHGLSLTQLAPRLVVSGLALLKLAGHSKEAIREQVNMSLDRNWDKLNFGSGTDEELF